MPRPGDSLVARAEVADRDGGFEPRRIHLFDGGLVDLVHALVAREPALVEGELDYLDVVDADTFQPCPPRAGALVIGAARFGGTRLIDNLILEAP
jgi:hypothetical protein